jgi:hypothetical protein
VRPSFRRIHCGEFEPKISAAVPTDSLSVGNPAQRFERRGSLEAERSCPADAYPKSAQPEINPNQKIAFGMLPLR